MEDSKVLIKNNKLSPLKLLLSLEKTKKKICNLINNDCLNYILSFLNFEILYSISSGTTSQAIYLFECLYVL